MPTEKTVPAEAIARTVQTVELRTRELIAYRLFDWPPMRIVPAARTRQWMDDTRQRFANRCLPLLMANQAGWWVLNSHPFEVVWSGGWAPSCIRITSLDGSRDLPVSTHFGEGVLTFTMPFLFRTPPGYNLLARGPANLPKDGIQALEGLVETDWTNSTFTMNWKFTRPHVPAVFEKDEPICMVVPQPRGLLEQFEPKIRNIGDEPEVQKAFTEWSKSRNDFLKALKSSGSPESKDSWQKHYFRGIEVDGTPAPEHQSKLGLKEFEGAQPIDTYPKVPSVQDHPEAVGTLRSLGAGRVGPEEAFATLRQIFELYLPARASGQQGSLVGAMVARLLFQKLADQTPMHELARRWYALRGTQSDGLGAEAAVATFAVVCARAGNDPLLAEAFDRLWNQKLKAILPPME